MVGPGPPGQQTENPWADLGLPRGATKLEVKNAYMKLVQQYHPDKHMNSSHDERQRAEQYFKMVQHAYSLLTSKDSMHLNHTRQPAQWAQAAADEAMQKTAFTNRQIGLWVAGICFLSAGFVTCWTAVRRNYDDAASHDKQNIKVRERYCRQAKQWERNMSGEQLRGFMDERRAYHVQRGIVEGARGFVVGSGLAACFIGVFKCIQLSGAAKHVFKYPLVSFHLAPPAALFYITSVGIYGFYDRGFATVSPRGRYIDR